MIDETKARALCAAIYQAFGDRLKPRASEIIPRCRTRDFDREEQVRAALAGRHWQSLNTPFVEQWLWSCDCYLSPKAYRYYLPALLMAALEPTFEVSGLPSSVVSSLCADSYALYFSGDDCRLRQRQALLNDAQYAVVCEFLGLFFTGDEPDYAYNFYGYQAAQGLYWGWNRLDTPALRAAQEYYRRLRHFTYPEPADPPAAALCTEIRAAFADTPYPGDDQLAGSGWLEATEIGVEFRGLRWQSVHPRLLAYQYTATSFLSDAGLRYFLPAFLLADILYEASGCDSLYESGADPVFTLTHGLTGQAEPQPDDLADKARRDLNSRKIDWRAYAERQFAAYTRAERLAIIHYLEYQLEVVGSYNHLKIEAALADYWRPSLEAVI